MRLLDRYLLRELLTPFGFCLSAFLVVWISSDLFDKVGEFREARLQLGDVLEYYVVKSPQLLTVILPVALLLALLYALTNHARHHEITAMRAAGVSLWRLARPYLAVGLGLSLVGYYLNEHWATDAEERAAVIRGRRLPGGAAAGDLRLARDISIENTRDRRNWNIKVLNPDTMEMTGVSIVSMQKDGGRLLLNASRAIRTNEVWTFFEVWEFRFPPGADSEPQPTLQETVLERRDLTETPEEIRSEVAIRRGEASLKKRHRSEISLADLRNYLALHPNLTPGMRSWLDTKLHSRLAGPWKCLVVVLIALPFGVGGGRRNVFAGVAGSIGICFAYFAILEISLAAGTAGYLPGWVAGWLPNLSFSLLGIWLTSRVR